MIVVGAVLSIVIFLVDICVINVVFGFTVVSFTFDEVKSALSD